MIERFMGTSEWDGSPNHATDHAAPRARRTLTVRPLGATVLVVAALTGAAHAQTLSVAGADRALRDVEAAMDATLAMPLVDRTRVVIGGQSRGGILSVAYAGAPSR